MLARQILGYIPSLVIPAIAAFGAIFCYTRLLTPGAYGHYALALNSMTLLSAVFFYWLQTALPRLMPEAVRQGRAKELRVTAYAAYLGLSAMILILALPVLLFLPLGELREVAWFAVPLALARSLLNMNQAFHRSALDYRRYNIIECGQAVLGLGLGLGFVYVLKMGSAGAILGLLIGMIAMTLVDLKLLLSARRRDGRKDIMLQIARFGAPLVISYGFSFVISTSDRFLVEHFWGAGQVGIYAAGYSLMDRIAQILFMMVATPSFPLTIHRLEHEGEEAARRQTYDNGVAVLAIAVPACAGLILCNHPLGTILIGADFREGAYRIMPWIALSTLFNGLATHYFDHAFHLAKKPHLLLYSQGPTALFNVGLNLYLIPKLGYMGAVYSTVASYMLLLALSITVGRRAFPIRFPFKPAWQIGLSTLAMVVTLRQFTFPETIFGLGEMAALGGGVYLAMVWLLDVAGFRRKLGGLAVKLRKTDRTAL